MKQMETKLYWMYDNDNVVDKLIAMSVNKSSICEDINQFKMLQCEMTQEQAESFIPKNTQYCYHGKYCCPFHDSIPHFPKQSNGYCHFLKKGDDSGFGLLWDSCKECGISEDE